MTRPALALLLALAGGIAQAQTVANEAWVRATVPGQKATGLFVELRSPSAARLVGGSTPLAESVEVHEMSMHEGVMRMRALPALELPAGQAVTLAPGGFHIMLMGLKQAVKVGEQVPVSLKLEHPGGKTETLQLQATVRATAPGH